MDELRFAEPTTDDARSVLRRARAAHRRRQHRERTFVAVAVVALVVGSVIGLARARDEGARDVRAGATPGPQGTIAAPTGPPTGSVVPMASSDGVPRIVLPGWTTTRFHADDARDPEATREPYVEYEFASGAQRVQVSFYPVADFEARAQHGLEVVDLRGTTGRLLDYGRGRFRVNFLEQGRTWEADGEPYLSREAFLDVVGAIQFVDDQTWKASLPADAVTADTRFETVDQILVQVQIPPGFDVEALKTKNQPTNRYDLTVSVLGSVECAWIRRWLDAPPDSTQRPQAVAALGGVKTWPALRALRADGPYPDVAVDYAQRAIRGDRAALADYQQALGC